MDNLVFYILFDVDPFGRCGDAGEDQAERERPDRTSGIGFVELKRSEFAVAVQSPLDDFQRPFPIGSKGHHFVHRDGDVVVRSGVVGDVHTRFPVVDRDAFDSGVAVGALI